MNLNTEPILGEVNSPIMTIFVTKQDENFFPLFTAAEVNRDNFIQLRKELIALGCNHDKVIATARELCMKVMDMTDIHDYNMYILNQTYKLCLSKILYENVLSETPIQDLTSSKYSHINLFSSIYGFEINYLQKSGIHESVCDLGCGDGLFLRLLYDHNIKSEGYEVEIKQVRHPVTINHIQDIEDIKEPYEAVTLNHVLEHIDEHPNAFISRLITHMNSLGEKKLKTIIISLPLHLSIQAHLASGHNWVCYPKEIPTTLKNMFAERNLKFYCADQELLLVALQHGYTLSINERIGTYVIERSE